MSLNKTKIEWTDFTWNPITGCWGPGGSREKPNWCPYCYAKKIATRFEGTIAFPRGFEPTFHPDRLVEPYKLKKPSRIFTCSMSDLFGSWLPDHWIGEVLFTVANNPKHAFMVFTKCPKNLFKWDKFFPANLWVGVSVNEQKDIERIFYLRMIDPKIRFISFEPLLGPIDINLDRIDWIIIGAQTNPVKIPKKDWVLPLIEQARKNNIPIFLKNNLHWHEVIQEFPNQRSIQTEKVARLSSL
jgi:protein gp37